MGTIRQPVSPETESPPRTPIDQRPKWRSEAFRRRLRSQPCIFTATKDSQRVDPTHIRSVGAGHDDYRNLVSARNDIHPLTHEKGWEEVLRRHGKDRDWLYAEADRLLVNWLCVYEGDGQ